MYGVFIYIKGCLKTVFTLVVKSKWYLYSYCLYFKNKIGATFSKNLTISKS